MSWKLRWAGHNRGKVRVYREDGSYFYAYPLIGGVINWLGNRKKLNAELKKTANMNAILSGNGELIEMPKSIIKTKLIQWAETDSSYWRDTEVARESGNPSDLDGYLFMKWEEWKKLEGYK